MGTKEENKVCAVEPVECEPTDEALVIRLETVNSSPATLMKWLQEPLALLNELDFDLEDAHGISYEALQEKADELMAEVNAIINCWIYARAQESCSIIEGIFDAHGVEALAEFDEETGDLIMCFDFDHVGLSEED